MCILSREFFEEEKKEAPVKTTAGADKIENNEEVVKHLNLAVKLAIMKVYDPEQDRIS